MLIYNDYIKLLANFPPRPITSEAELELTQTIIDKLLDKGKLSQDEKDYLNVLGALVYEYEQQQEPIPDIYGVELLKSLIEDNGLRQKDLVSIFKTESIVSDVLNGKRELTKRHIEELAEFFHVSPAVFFPRNPVY
ncbi:type II toxin-antitoxin system HigA family antitoxin [Planktothrix sp. FACHB-1365]|uniref:helix-turn-helix domain-containing protein n=1 Tax=Planktothrix sp. FACHB-1365 TaxID=2692855 RepID=UPI001688B3E1|nr:transcriptional regulator [Planktothrix sp. FACHB-1365]MBD2481665.1 transcriptional regulator [Planktothrix sp. FACHB-1365]